MLCRLPELVSKFASVSVRFSVARMFPELVRIALLKVIFFAALSSPLFCKLPLRVRKRELESEEIVALELLVRLFAVTVKFPFDKILLEFVIADAPVISKFPKAEISPKFVSELLKLRVRFAAL